MNKTYTFYIVYLRSMKAASTIFYLILSGTILMFSACGNHSGTNDTTNLKGLDSSENAQMTKGVTVKERQRFHTQAQRSIDSMQRIVDNTDRAMKKRDNPSRQKWDGTRDSLRQILDHANRKLNNQAYKSDDEWRSIVKTVGDAIDSTKAGLRRVKE